MTRSSIVRTFVLLAASVVATGCFYPKAGPAPEALSPAAAATAGAKWPGVTAASLSNGRDLFVARCNSCHAYPDIAAIADDHWPHIMDKMAGKAGLTSEQKGRVRS
jgi:cytochrome c5